MKYYTYEEFKQDTRELVKKVDNEDYDAIVGIARGGLMLSHALSEALEIRNVQTLRTELYDSSVKRDNFLMHDYTLLENLKRVLVVDDIADSGETLQKVIQHLEKRYPDIAFESATLFYKESSVYEPTYWVKEAKEWIEFFWESDFKVVSL
jgi:xanthine phosphoribosyltransferase